MTSAGRWVVVGVHEWSSEGRVRVEQTHVRWRAGERRWDRGLVGGVV